MIHDVFRIADADELDDKKLKKFIKQNDEKGYQELWDAYSNDYDIYDQRAKAEWKPDNRISVNYARYITDTFIGFAYGIPVKVISNDDAIQEYISELDARTCEDDVIVELATLSAIFGRAYRIVFVDEDGEIGTACIDPRESFMIYSESILSRARYFVRTYIDANKVRRGSISDEFAVKYFHIDGDDIIWDDAYLHGFGCVPAVECMMNTSRHGIYQDVLSLINAYNKVISEKANDCEYFADAYMKILGAALDESTIRFMRENRVINLAGKSGSDVIVDFLQKPSADETQEHLLDRIQREIFTIAMVCNISDDNFATSSGIALRYKMLPMVNLASAAWRKMKKSLIAYYRMVCASPITPLREDAWQSLSFIHSLNYPANISDEASTAARLDGIVSKRTQLSTLSIVDDIDDELARIREDEEAESDIITPYAKPSENGGDDA